MTPKIYLQQAYKLDRRIKITLRKAEKLRSVLEYRSPAWDDTGGSGSLDKMADTVARVLEYEKRANELTNLYTEKFVEIEKAIQEVEDPVQREVLERRYLLYQSWNTIAEEMHYTERRIFQLHGKGLQKISLNFSIDV